MKDFKKSLQDFNKFMLINTEIQTIFKISSNSSTKLNNKNYVKLKKLWTRLEYNLKNKKLMTVKQKMNLIKDYWSLNKREPLLVIKTEITIIINYQAIKNMIVRSNHKMMNNKDNNNLENSLKIKMIKMMMIVISDIMMINAMSELYYQKYYIFINE